MEATENTAIIDNAHQNKVFTPADVLSEFGAGFLDEIYCCKWITKRLHGAHPHCPGCHVEIPERLLLSFCEWMRVRCNRCGKYFTAFTGTFLSGCHFTASETVLLAFMLELEIPNRQIAETLKISAESVRLWRHRFAAMDQAQRILPGDNYGN